MRRRARSWGAAVVAVVSLVSSSAGAQASERLAAVRARFVVARDAAAWGGAGLGHEELVPALAVPRARFQRAAGAGGAITLTPRWASVEAVVPARADGWISVRRLDTPAAVSFRWLGVAPGPAELAEGSVVFPRAAPGGGDVVVQAMEDGVEDYLVLEVAPGRGEVELTVRLEGAAGLRLVADSLALLDAAGTPLLHMHPPVAVGADGARHRVRVELSGCRYDSDPRGPWGRPVTPPGASECRVSLALPSALAYPALLDPRWTSAGSHASVGGELGGLALLPSGRVLMPGAVTQVYDPATETWSTTADPPVPRIASQVATLPDGVVVMAGGKLTTRGEQAVRDADGYVEATGDWIPAPTLHVERCRGRAFLLSDGRMMVADGTGFNRSPIVPFAEALDPATGWAKYDYYEDDIWVWGSGSAVVDGGVVLVGGIWGKLGIEGRFSTRRIRLLDVRSGALGHAPGSATLVHRTEAALLEGNRFAMFGGLNDPPEDDDPFAGVQVVDLDDVRWADGGVDEGGATWTTHPLPARSWHSLVTLPGGDILLVGGTAELELGSIRVHGDLTWEPIPMAYERWLGRSVLLLDGTVLAAGGTDAVGEVLVAERLRFDDPVDAGVPDSAAEDAGQPAFQGAGAEPGACSCRASGASGGAARGGGMALAAVLAGGWLARGRRRRGR